ncbi:hypothetical protein BD289DRAFT_504322 [Coniella lustricola]|uniref:Uncharacterized protein n=1 Tax=Coniella lustricola TaxID=2025994 RepID=A0A2T3AE98_9PEZI|nr:hypothetical protein BD289DRAFT_504322 [Coniella lustricola]
MPSAPNRQAQRPHLAGQSLPPSLPSSSTVRDGEVSSGDSVGRNPATARARLQGRRVSLPSLLSTAPTGPVPQTAPLASESLAMMAFATNCTLFGSDASASISNKCGGDGDTSEPHDNCSAKVAEATKDIPRPDNPRQRERRQSLPSTSSPSRLSAGDDTAPDRMVNSLQSFGSDLRFLEIQHTILREAKELKDKQLHQKDEELREKDKKLAEMQEKMKGLQAQVEKGETETEVSHIIKNNMEILTEQFHTTSTRAYETRDELVKLREELELVLDDRDRLEQELVVAREGCCGLQEARARGAPMVARKPAVMSKSGSAPIPGSREDVNLREAYRRHRMYGAAPLKPVVPSKKKEIAAAGATQRPPRPHTPISRNSNPLKGGPAGPSFGLTPASNEKDNRKISHESGAPTHPLMSFSGAVDYNSMMPSEAFEAMMDYLNGFAMPPSYFAQHPHYPAPPPPPCVLTQPHTGLCNPQLNPYMSLPTIFSANASDGTFRGFMGALGAREGPNTDASSEPGPGPGPGPSLGPYPYPGSVSMAMPMPMYMFEEPQRGIMTREVLDQINWPVPLPNKGPSSGSSALSSSAIEIGTQAPSIPSSLDVGDGTATGGAGGSGGKPRYITVQPAENTLSSEELREFFRERHILSSSNQSNDGNEHNNGSLTADYASIMASHGGSTRLPSNSSSSIDGGEHYQPRENGNGSASTYRDRYGNKYNSEKWEEEQMRAPPSTNTPTLNDTVANGYGIDGKGTLPTSVMNMLEIVKAEGQIRESIEYIERITATIGQHETWFEGFTQLSRARVILSDDGERSEDGDEEGCGSKNEGANGEGEF